MLLHMLLYPARFQVRLPLPQCRMHLGPPFRLLNHLSPCCFAPVEQPEPWIGVPPGFPFDEIRRSIEQVTGAATEVRQRVRDNRIVESLVAAGLGIALLPRFTTRCEGLELRALAGVGATRWVVAMSRPDRAERGAVRAVLAELERIAAEVAGQMGAPR